MTKAYPFVQTLALIAPFTLLSQGEVQFNRSDFAVPIDRVFVLAGGSTPCEGVEIDAQAVAEYAEVRLLSQYQILERKHLEMILQEQSLGMSGLVFEDEAVEAGCLQGSEGIVFCEVGCLAGQSLVKVKLVDCKESVQQWSAVGIDVTIKSIFDRIEGKQALNPISSETRPAASRQTFRDDSRSTIPEKQTSLEKQINDCEVEVPSIFTPGIEKGSKGKKNTFEINGLLQYAGSVLVVYNRWGEMIFESNNYDNLWDAQDTPSGTYYYSLTLSCGKDYRGTLQLIH